MNEPFGYRCVTELDEFLGCPTPAGWLRAVPHHLPELLIDHANCEKKAAAAALMIMQRLTRDRILQRQLSRLAREELRHFEQVLGVLHDFGIEYRFLTASRYAAGLRRGVRRAGPERLVDLLLVGAFIEARSCERFGAMQSVLDGRLAAFYARLQRSEERHFKVYLELAGRLGGAGLGERIAAFRQLESDLIRRPADEFRFHSGPPASGAD